MVRFMFLDGKERCCGLYFVQLPPVLLPSNLHLIFFFVVAVAFVFGVVVVFIFHEKSALVKI